MGAELCGFGEDVQLMGYAFTVEPELGSEVFGADDHGVYRYYKDMKISRGRSDSVCRSAVPPRLPARAPPRPPGTPRCGSDCSSASNTAPRSSLPSPHSSPH